jgi:hypothetical protein
VRCYLSLKRRCKQDYSDKQNEILKRSPVAPVTLPRSLSNQRQAGLNTPNWLKKDQDRHLLSPLCTEPHAIQRQSHVTKTAQLDNKFVGAKTSFSLDTHPEFLHSVLSYSVWLIKIKVKVNQSHYRPGEAQRVAGGWGFQISRHEGGKVVSPKHRPSLPTRKYSWYSFLLEAESTQGP